MAREAVTARRFARGKPVMDVSPVIGSNIARVDAQRLDRIDQAEHLRDLRPAMNAEKHVAAGIDLRHRRAGFARFDGADDVER